MIKFETKTIETKVESDIICDACGNSCVLDKTAPIHTAEYATLMYCWGFDSKGLDDLRGQHHLCQDCWQDTLVFLKIKHSVDDLKDKQADHENN